MLTAGSVWGEEHLLLLNPILLVPNTACTLSFVEVMSLDRTSFEKVCDECPESLPMIRKYYIKYAVIRGILYEAGRRKKLEEPDSPSCSPSHFDHHDGHAD